MSTAMQRHELGFCSPRSCAWCFETGDVEDAPCETCGTWVHLQHFGPCDHGTVVCPNHWPAHCCDEEE